MDKCEGCGEYLPGQYLEWRDDMGGLHDFCNEICQIMWVNNLDQPDRVALTGQVGFDF